jgi:hypothetical protein
MSIRLECSETPPKWLEQETGRIRGLAVGHEGYLLAFHLQNVLGPFLFFLFNVNCRVMLLSILDWMLKKQQKFVSYSSGDWDIHEQLTVPGVW